jgi:uncharacterized protein (TIGR00369 family)
MHGADTHSVMVELPTDVYEQLDDEDGTTAAGSLASLAKGYARQRDAIETYTDRDSEMRSPMTMPTDVNPPIAELLGFDVAAVGDGEAVMTFEAGPQHANPMGTLHGGILCDVGDAAMGYAYASTLGADESFTTLELKVNYLRPVWDATLTATGHVVSGGRTVGLVECDIHDEEERLVARLSSTCLTLRDEQAKGR